MLESSDCGSEMESRELRLECRQKAVMCTVGGVKSRGQGVQKSWSLCPQKRGSYIVGYTNGLSLP